MTIQEITVDTTGQVNVNPRIVKIVCDNTLAEITTEGFLNNNTLPQAIKPTDIVLVYYAGSENYEIGFFQPVFGEGNAITLQTNTSDIEIPTIANYMAAFSNTQGGLKNGADPIINPGSIQAGYSGKLGYLTAYPVDALKGYLRIAANSNTNNDPVLIQNGPHGQATTYSLRDIGQATGYFLTSTIPCDPSSNLIAFDKQVTALNLAAGQLFPLYTATQFGQYKIRALQINKGGINFSGGGGDRLAEITDGTTSYSIIPAASLQTLVNAQWGATALPNPASAAINTSTVVSANLSIRYSGGTADYVSGTFTVSGLLEKVV